MLPLEPGVGSHDQVGTPGGFAAMCSTSVTMRTLPVVSVFLPLPVLLILAGDPPGYWQNYQVQSTVESMPDLCGAGNQTQGSVHVTQALHKQPHTSPAHAS